MLPVIYSPSSSEFRSNGLGILVDCTSCKVTEERNGIFEMEFTYPVNGRHADAIVMDAIVKATAHYGDEGQLFTVYQVEKNISGELHVMCQHISYRLSMIPCRPFIAKNAAQAFFFVRDNMITDDNPFTFITDKVNTGKFIMDKPYSTKMILGGCEGSILDVYGGEYEFDNFNVMLHNNRGIDRNVVIRYGKNLTDLSQDESIAETFTHIFPFYSDDEGNYVELDELYIPCENASKFSFKRIATVDMSSEMDSVTDENGDPISGVPTKAQLKAAAEIYMKDHSFGIPEVNLNISFEPIWDYTEYSGLVALETVNLCDTVKVLFPELNIVATAQVIKTVYDTLLDKYESLEIGSAKSMLSDMVARSSAVVDEKIEDATTRMESAVGRATDKLTGATGGYIYTELDGEGNPTEQFIMDEPDKSRARRVWRWNLNGLGYSSNGLNGPYGLAITSDGEIVADYITTGKLDADLVDVVNLKAQNIIVGSSTLDSELNSYDTRITANANGLTSKVAYTEYNGETVASLINQSADSVTIEAKHLIVNASNINLEGVVTANSTFRIDTDGSMHAIGGTLGGFTIGETAITNNAVIDSNNVEYGVRIYAPSTTTSETLAYAARYRTNDGSTVTGWMYPWYVKYNGSMHAEKGDIGGWNIGATSLSSSGNNRTVSLNKYSSAATDHAFDVIRTTSSTTTNPLYIEYSGKLFASNADISGKISADSGAIGGFRIGTTYLDGLSDPSGSSGTQYRVALFRPGTIEDKTVAIAVRTRTYTKDGSEYSYGSWTPKFEVTYGGDITIAGSGTIGGCSLSTSTGLNVTASHIDSDSLKDKIASYDKLTTKSLTVNNGLVANKITINTSGGLTFSGKNVLFETYLAVQTDPSIETASVKPRWYALGSSTTWADFRTAMQGKYILIGVT